MIRALVILIAFGVVVSAAAGQPAMELALLTFNIRYGTAPDGANAWANRADFVAEVIREAGADVVGLQEALRGQLDHLAAALPRYAEVGVGRDDGRTRGEHATILYDRARFAVDESGTFWLSETPETPGSMHWGNRITRICTWARLVDKATGRAVYVYNVHLDHESQASRERSVRLIAERIGARTHADPVVVMGDFNAGEGNPAVLFLTGRAGVPPMPMLKDSFRALHPDETEVGTFNAFRLGNTGGAKIDHVFVPADAEVLDAAIVRTEREGRYASDHFPVSARIRLP
ncbi:MAG: endonuclease/exonuclease/phosphatase family protein [Phycisphaeraceae bacterium]|nr:endonuclease/exonuclease/phosphatase family protein [Phycisphaeraceae bacterium]